MINEDIWGTSETWVDTLEGDIAKTTPAPLWSFIRSGDWTLNQLVDNSPCFAGTIGDHYLASPIVFFENDEVIDLYEPDLVNNWFVFQNKSRYWYGWNGTFTQMDTPNTRWSQWQSATDMPDTTAEMFNNVLFNFKIKKMCLLPYVTCQENQGLTTPSHRYTLGDYVANHTSDYPYITGIEAVLLYDESETDTPTWKEAAANVDDQYWIQCNYEFSDAFKNSVGNNSFHSSYSVFGGSTNKRYITIMGFKAGQTQTISNNGMIPYHPVGLDSDLTHYVYNDDHDRVMYCRAWSTDVLADIYKQLAFTGFFFIGSGTDAIGSHVSLLSENMFIGTIEDDNCLHGNYTRGPENEDAKQFEWNDTSESEYDTSNPPKVDPNNYNVGMHTNYPWITSPNKLYSIGSTNAAAINDLYNSLWECYYTNNVGTDPDMISPSEFNFDEFLTVSPIDTIISLKLFPYDTKSASSFMGIRLGKYNTGVNAHPALMFNILDFGKVNIFAYFGDAIEGDWRDRETKYTFYAPFCGTLDLDPAFYMGHDVHLEYWIDQVTGACTAALYIIDSYNVKVYGDTISGVCAVDIPITGVDQATIQAQIFNANQQLKNANINAASSLISSTLSIMGNAAAGNVAGAAGAAISGVANFAKANNAVESAEYNLHHNKMTPRIIGAASPLCSQLGDWIPRIIISIPKDGLNNSSRKKFAETKGFACIIPGRIGSRSGFVQAINVKIIPPADATTAPTEAEAEMIKSLLAGGIYI